ncbi:MAG TPA: VWA domain-containing protein [Terriglobales bacterium]|nr:VWA domain-containing protein [Terriglobales bacterium]
MGRDVVRKWQWASWLAAGLLCLTSVLGAAQQQQQKPQDIPDAPSATRPPQPFPPPTAPVEPAPENPPAPADQATEPAPKPNIKTVPEGQATSAGTNTRDELYTLQTRVNFVVVPVTVKDKNTGKLVDGLLPRDFSVYEDGVKQKLTYFTSDPFFLSAAVIFDLGMSDASVQKVNQTFTALQGAFSQYDQVSIYTYSSTASRLTDFTQANQRLTQVLNELKTDRGRNNGVPVVSGPLASGPVINGMPVGGGPVPVSTPPKESHVLNDAILRAALDLAKQDRTRRKIIFVISDGRELGSTASYADTLKVLLTNQISVYGVATDSSSLPAYKQLSKLHLPRQGYDNLLPKYAAATGGEVFPEFSRPAIEVAYGKATGDARNQYTLGYQTKAVPSSAYRDIEVRVDVPDLEVRARAGYYPLPPSREGAGVNP